MRISSLQIFKKNVDLMQQKQVAVLETQEQIASGNRINSPADDPVAFARITLLNRQLTQVERLDVNRQTANDRLTIEEDTLEQIESAVERLRSLQIQSGDAALDRTSREALAVETEEILGRLVSYANAQDVNDHYLFAGSQVLQQPITLNTTTNRYEYNGDDIQRQLDVSTSYRVPITDSGEELFMNIHNSNGDFTAIAGIDAAANVTFPAYPVTVNAGSALINTHEVVDRGVYIENIDDYFITFTDNLGQLEYTVTDSNGGPVVNATPYNTGDVIAFRGIEVTMDGPPQTIMDGDIHRIEPVADESMFTTVQDMITNLRRSNLTNTEVAVIQDENEHLLFQLDLIRDAILDIRTDVGARLNNVESAGLNNEQIIITSKSSISILKDTDITEAVTTLSVENFALQAIQQSYVQIQNLSLFNFL